MTDLDPLLEDISRALTDDKELEALAQRLSLELVTSDHPWLPAMALAVLGRPVLDILSQTLEHELDETRDDSGDNMQRLLIGWWVGLYADWPKRPTRLFLTLVGGLSAGSIDIPVIVQCLHHTTLTEWQTLIDIAEQMPPHSSSVELDAQTRRLMPMILQVSPSAEQALRQIEHPQFKGPEEFPEASDAKLDRLMGSSDSRDAVMATLAIAVKIPAEGDELRIDMLSDIRRQDGSDTPRVRRAEWIISVIRHRLAERDAGD